jgi:hypothetical protein
MQDAQQNSACTAMSRRLTVRSETKVGRAICLKFAEVLNTTNVLHNHPRCEQQLVHAAMSCASKTAAVKQSHMNGAHEAAAASLRPGALCTVCACLAWWVNGLEQSRSSHSSLPISHP